MYDAAVIGAGVTGAFIARELSRYDMKVCIIEKENDVCKGSTMANSAIVHAGFDAKEGSLKAKLNVEGSKMMESVCRELGVKYENNGSIVLGFDDDDKAEIDRLYERGIKNGVSNLKILKNHEEILKEEPNVGDSAIYALYAPTGAIVCPYELGMAAIGNAMDNGAELILNFAVDKIEDKDGVYGIYCGDKCIEAKTVINAAGMYSDKIAKMAGDSSFTVHPRRGEYILLDKEVGGMVNHTVFQTPGKLGKGVLVTRTVDGNLLVGPTSVDMEDKEDKSTTSEGLDYLKVCAAKSIKNIPYKSSITSFCGLRSVGSTGDFIINSPKKGFINVAGIESPGLSASPATAKYVINLMKEANLLGKEKENFDPVRKPLHYFRDASIEEKNEIIKKNPAFGKIICRCEKVTEGEIIEAIMTNPRPSDLDGVKRRTRAQMGRCHGGFCMPSIVKILSDKLSVPFENITKSGKGSYVNIGKTKEGK